MWFRNRTPSYADIMGADEDRHVVIPVHEPEVTIPRPRGRLPTVAALAPQTYAALARKLNFAPAALTRNEVLAFFRANDIKVFDYQKVGAYMQQAVDRSDDADCWIWRPLRAEDAFSSEDGVSLETEAGDTIYDSRDDICAPYDKLIPARVLGNTAKIADKFGARVKFFVTDYADHKPDPFIAIWIGDHNLPAEQGFIIFDVWDEPGFKG